MRIRLSVSGVMLLAGFLFFLPSNSDAQVTRTTIDAQVERTYAYKLGQTAPIRDYLAAQSTSNEKLRLLKENKPSYVRNFTGRERREIKEGALPIGVDPLLNNKTTRSGGLLIEPELVIEGIDQNQAGSGVPDPNGDVSDLHYVEVTNSTWIQVYDHLGEEVGDAFRANAIWQQVGMTSAGDPILLFDQEADRWFLTEFPPSSRVLIAISDTNDPLGTWTAYAFQTPQFPDYPHYGIWDSAYVLTTNEGGSEGLKYYLFNRHDLLDSKDTVDMQRFTTPRPVGGFFVSTPVNWIGHMAPAAGTRPMVMNVNDDGWGGVTEDVLEVYEINVDWDDENNTSVEKTSLTTTPFDTDLCSETGPNFACIPVPSGGGIDGLPDILMNKVEYRNFGSHSSIVLNFAIDVTGEQDAGIRWMELRKTGDEPWEIYQEGTVGTLDGENRFMGGISIDSKGNIGLAYSVSSETTFPSLRYTGRFASDALGEMSVDEYEFGTGGGSVTGRFGDYASMSVDAQDIFWYTGEYIISNNFWGTKNVAFRLERFASDIGPIAVVEPEDSPDLTSERLSVAIRNFGIMPQTEFQMGYSFNGEPTIVETVMIDTLFTDSTYTHTFQDEIQFDAFGEYPLIVFTSMLSDSNTFNDTSDFVINKQSLHDADLYAIDGVPQLVCDTFVNVDIVLRNNGQAPLTSADIGISVNGEDQPVIAWTGKLATGAMTLISDVPITNLKDGSNEVVFVSSNPNGMDDQDQSNDRIDLDINVTSGGIGVTLNLLTDLFPAETTWELQDLDGNMLFGGGPLSNPQTLHTEDWCLELDSCYQFVLFDTYGDGLTAQGVDGDFVIVNADGGVLANLGEPNFGSELVTEFCVTTGCSLGANISVAHETKPGASNGLINIFAGGGTPPYQFSIDGGLTSQSSPIFAGLSPGTYQALVVDLGGCEVKSQIVILACVMQTMFEVTDATGASEADGSITVQTEGSSGKLTYSNNGGGAFQDSPVFENLMPGIYEMVVKDSVRCTVGDSVEVSFTSSIEPTTNGQLIRVFPNPSKGDFYIEVEGLSDVHRLKFQVIDGNGRVILSREAGNFSGVLKGYFTINNVPPGVYFLRFEHPDLNRLVRVIKQ